jgi:hypothetical protein
MVASGEVQVIPGQCGWVQDVPFAQLSDDAVFNAANALIVTARNVFRRSATYSRSCYAHAEGNTTVCGTFVQPALPYNTTRDAPCPFDQKICNASAILMDTGLLHSDEHLGADAMSLRKQLTCVPLAGEKYTDGWKVANDTDDAFESSSGALSTPAGMESIGYKFGPQIQTTSSIPSRSNYTFRIPRNFLQGGDLPYNIV